MRLYLIIGVLWGFYNAAIGQQLSASHVWMNSDNLEMSLDVIVDIPSNEARITLSGPLNEWFAYGFGQSQMSGTYAIIAEVNGGNTAVSERDLGFHNEGTLLESSITQLQTSNAGGKREISFIVPATGDDAYYEFPTSESQISFISAVGFGGNLEFHGGDNYTLGNALNTSALAFSSVVPVTWKRFEVDSEQDKVRLTWATSSEINNEGFYVERSLNAKTWETLGFVLAKDEQGSNYSFLDRQTVPGVAYYRLKQVDLDGDVHFSVIKSIEIRSDEDVDDIAVFPNPVKDHFTLSKKAGKGEARVQLYDMNFKLIQDFLWSIDGPERQVDISTLQGGHYFLMIKHREWTHMEGLIKL